MQIEFSQHCLEQLRIRKRITKHMVIAAVTMPDQIIDSYRGRKMYKKSYETDMLEVVVKIEDNKLIIIIAYLLGQQL
jgi:hypothetical protein